MTIDNEGQQISTEEARAVRAWAGSPAPGEDDASSYRPPRLQAKRRLPIRRWMYQAAAAVLLFSLGYFTGTARDSGVAELPAGNKAVAPARTVKASATPAAPQGVQPPPAAPQEKEDCPSPQVYQGNDGHFRINTTLCESGSRATWVINPKLELASAPEPNLEEKQ